jgi:uncharacterized membrane protein
MDPGQILWYFLLSGAPVTEIRFTIPYLIIKEDVLWYWALPVCFLGNLLPVPFLLLFLEPVTNFLRKVDVFDRIIHRVFERTRRKGGVIERYGPWGLVFFVAIPLPGTGGWTGCIAAHLFGIPFRRAVPPVVVGILLAAIVVTILSVIVPEALEWLLINVYEGD